MKKFTLLIILFFQLPTLLFCQTELTISYIHRTPEIDFVQGSSNPSIDGWPSVGQAITWEGKIKNWSNTNIINVSYKWYLNNTAVASGNVNIPANAEVTVDYNTTWSFSRNQLKLVIDENNQVAEEEENNNELTIFTDAITVGLYVEQTVYDYFRQNQSNLNVNSVCWEDWAHRQVEMWNDMFANAIYPSVPNGVLDRIRLDKITIVADGALPLAGGIATNDPNNNDKTVDLLWGFPTSLISDGFYNNVTDPVLTNPFYYEGGVIHELGHARYLVDEYGFNIDAGVPGERIEIMENGTHVLDTEYMPFIVWDIPFLTTHKGFMNDVGATTVSEFAVLCMNRIAGHRATEGNTNAPGNIGEFLSEIPTQNEVTIKDNLGNALTNASVDIYQASGLAGVWYGAKYDNVPDLNFTTDAQGKVLLGANPFSMSGNIFHTYGFSNGVIILRVENSSGVGYGFMDLPTFNVEYFRGNTNFASYDLVIENWVANANPTDCPNSINNFTSLGEFENSKYFISNEPSQWQAAQSTAVANGGYLASINSQSENDFILGNISEIVFIGFNDAQTEGTFEWASGESVIFDALTETNTDERDYARMNFWNGNWGLDGQFVSRKYILEVPCDNSGGGGITVSNCPADINAPGPAANNYQAIVNWNLPTATTGCNEGGLTITQIQGPTSGSSFSYSPNGSTIVYEITDACDNSEFCIFFITVNPEATQYTCPDDISITATSSAGAVVNYNAPTLISFCTPTNNPYNLIGGLPSGSVFPVGTTEVSLSNFLGGPVGVCQVNAVCSFNITVLPENGGGGGCPDDISGFTTIGEFGNSKYYISNDVSRAVDAQAIAESNGGYLATISSQEENDFIQQGISEMTYIGLTDEAIEGTLEWFNGASLTYNNVNPCGFCNENSDDQDYVVMAPWDGAWSFSNFWNQRKYIMEIPCGSGGSDECSFNVTFDASYNGNVLGIEDFTETQGGYQMTSYDLLFTPELEVVNYLRSKENGNEVSTSVQQLTRNPNAQNLNGYWDKENNVYYSGEIIGDDQITLVKYNSTGNVLWSSDIDMTGIELYNPLRIKSLDDEIIIVSNAGPNNFFPVTKTDLNGNLIWKKTINANVSSGTLGTVFGESNDGGYYIRYWNSGPFLAKINAVGDFEWVVNNGTGDPPSEKRDIIGLSGDGSRVYFRRNSFNSFKGFLTVYDTNTGNASWSFAAGSAFAGGSSAYRSSISNAIPTEDGGVVIVYSYHLGSAPATFINLHERFDADGNLIWSRETPEDLVDFLNEKTIAAEDGGFLFAKDFANLQNPDWTITRMTSDGYFEPDCGGGNQEQPDLTVSNLTNVPSSGEVGEIVFFNFDLNNIGNAIASGDYVINSYISTDAVFSADDVLAGEVPTGDTPIGTIANVPGAISVPSLPDGNYYLIVVADALEEITESDENNNTISASFEITSDNTGGGDCPTELEGYTSLGEFNGSAYFLSNDVARPVDGQAAAAALGGYLATIDSQEENDFLFSQIGELAYIGLNDENVENTLEWFSGDPVNYTNFDICGFCNGNSDNMNFVVMHSWNGGWSWSNYFNQRKYIVEIPCSSSSNNVNIGNALIAQLSPSEENVSLLAVALEKVYPNPSEKFIFTKIKSPKEQTVDIQIFDARGSLKYTRTADLLQGENIIEISIADFPAGFYSIFIPQAQGKNSTQRFMKIRD